MRTLVTRLLLLVLTGVTLLFLVYSWVGPAGPEGVVVFVDDFEVDQLRHAAFRAEAPVTVEIEGTGSLQSDSAFATYGWITRRADHELVWAMSPAEARRERGALAVQQSRVELDPGTYDVYYVSFGDPLRPVAQGQGVLDRLSRFFDEDFERWRTEADRWRLVVRAASEADRAHLNALPGEDGEDVPLSAPDQFWATGSMTGNQSTSFHFAVTRPTTVRVDAVGEWYRGPRDYGWIEDMRTGERVWEMTLENTMPAGGSVKNRVAHAELALEPGPYRAVFETDRRHDYHRWSANPPFYPADWGLRLSADEGAVESYDPDLYFPRIADLTRVGDDEIRSRTFVLDRELRVWIRALGEYTHGHWYDYAWLLDEEDDKTIWEMEVESSTRAGGNPKNRAVDEILTLEPGTYTLYYKTDDSHAYGAWNADRPDEPERWGATLYALDPGYVPEIADEAAAEEYMQKVEAEGALVFLKALRNDAQVQQSFTLDERAAVHIYAVGEMTLDDRYDYGWIVSDDTGETVWTMERRNTEPAGGEGKNRKFDGRVTLPAGTYTAHFVTDGSHAYDSFEGAPPDDPDAWGIVVRLAGEELENGG